MWISKKKWQALVKRVILLEEKEKNHSEIMLDHKVLEKSYMRTTARYKGAAVLREASTKELVEELIFRTGVKEEYAEPHEDKTITVNGPARVLIVTD